MINYGGATLLDYARGEFIRLAEGYVWFNPHLTLRGSWYGKEFINVAATNPDWKKWGRAIRPARTGTTRPGCSVISPRM